MKVLVLIALIAMIAYSTQSTSWCASSTHPEITSAWCKAVCGTADSCYYGTYGYCTVCPPSKWCWIYSSKPNTAMNDWCQSSCTVAGGNCYPYNGKLFNKTVLLTNQYYFKKKINK